MYKLVRDIHLVLGLFASVFLLIYAASAGTMSVQSIYRPSPRSAATRTVEIDLPRDAPLPEVELRIRRAGVRGSIWQTRTSSTAVVFEFARPGSNATVRWEFGPTADVFEEQHSLIGYLESLHHLAGVQHDETIQNLWGVLVFLMSLVTLGMGITGVWLWSMRNSERRLGGALLAIATLVSLTLFVVIRL